MIKFEEGINPAEFASAITSMATTQKLRIVGIHAQCNPITSIYNIQLPVTLQCLDLSFCEDIKFAPSCFACVPALRSLRLESCGICDTKGLFFGLVRLEVLDLRDNSLETAEQVEGLLCFSLEEKKESNAESVEDMWVALIPAQEDRDRAKARSYRMSPSLRILSLQGNPLNDVSKVKAEVKLMLTSAIPSLTTLDGVLVNGSSSIAATAAATAAVAVASSTSAASSATSSLATSSSASVAALAISFRYDKNSVVPSTSYGMSDAEFLQALKGENDTTIVS